LIGLGKMIKINSESCHALDQADGC